LPLAQLGCIAHSARGLQARDDFLVTWDQLPGEAIAKAAFVEYYKADA